MSIFICSLKFENYKLQTVMMQEIELQNQKVTFKGNSFQFIKQIFLYLLFLLPLLSFLTLGRCWFHFCKVLLVLSLPVLFIFFIVNFLGDRFSFDDTKRQIIKIGWKIPYQRVKTIYLVEADKMLSVGIKKSWLQRIWLVQALDIEKKQQLLKELVKRFPKEILHQRKFRGWVFTVVFILGILILYSGFLFYVYRTSPQVQIVPQRKAWESVQDLLSSQKGYTLERVSFRLPKNFTLVKKEKQTLIFKDENKKTKLIVTPGIYKEPSFPKFLLYYAMGIKDGYDLFKVIYYAHFGIIPLSLKGVWLSNLSRVKIYEIERPPFKGFILEGIKNKKEFVDVVLIHRERGDEINFIISSLEKRVINRNILKMILGTLKTR